MYKLKIIKEGIIKAAVEEKDYDISAGRVEVEMTEDDVNNNINRLRAQREDKRLEFKELGCTSFLTKQEGRDLQQLELDIEDLTSQLVRLGYMANDLS